LFLYYINDIPTRLDSTISLCVDDKIAYLVNKSNSEAQTLQRDLAQWGQLWKMALHQDKCNMLIISRNKTPVQFIHCLHGHVLQSGDKAKYIGVTISEDTKWESHTNNKTLGFLRHNLNIGFHLPSLKSRHTNH
jgi:hypothetical protein